MKKFLAIMLALAMVFAISGAAMAWDVDAGSNTKVETSGDSATAWYSYDGDGATYTVTQTITNDGNATQSFALGISDSNHGDVVEVEQNKTATLEYTVSKVTGSKTFAVYAGDSQDSLAEWNNDDYTVEAKQADEATFAQFAFTNSSDTAFDGASLVLPIDASGKFTITATDNGAGTLKISYKIGDGSWDTSAATGSLTTSAISVPALNGSIKVTFRVTNQAGEITEKVFTISRPSNASLSSLKVKGVDTGDTYINSPNGTLSATTKGDEQIEITAAVENPSQYEIKINSTVVNSGAAKTYTLSDSSSGSTYTITVTNKDDSSDKRTYSVKLTMAQAADLDDLVVSLDEDGDDDLYLYRSSSLSSSNKGFKSTTYDYYLDTDEIGNDDDLYISVALPSRTDERTFDVDVDSEDRVRDVDDYIWRVETTGEDITIIISAAGYQDTEYTLHLDGSEDGELDDLAIYNGKNTTSSKYELDLYPSFDPSITEYCVFIPYDRNDDEYVTVLATAQDKKDYLKINNTEKTSTSTDELEVSVGVDFGDSEEITIEAGDSEYTVKVFRADRNADDDLGLSTMKLYTASSITSANEVSLTSTSTSGSTKKYSAVVPTSQTYVWLNTKAQHNSSYVLVDGKLVSEQTTSAKTTKIELKKTGSTTITIINMAEDCDTQERYEIVVTKGVADALLRSLTISSASGTLKYSPAFNNNTDYYCTNVSYNESVIYFTPTVNASGSTVKINGVTVSSGTKSAAFNVSVGQNTFDIAVTSSNGTVKHYYVNILRQAQNPVIKVTSQRLSVNGGTSQALAAYNIDGYNYLKLRDVAKLISGTSKQFNVGYDDVTRLVTMTTGSAYVSVGGELEIPSAYKSAKVSPQTIRLNGSNVYPMAYNIDGYNYFLMRDLALLLDCDIQYNANTFTVTLNTNKTFAN